MIIWYTDKIENKELGYCLYLDLIIDREFWYNYQTGTLYYSSGAGEVKKGLVGNETGVTLRKRNNG